jgi:adenylate kinase family enzyme
MQRIMIVGQPGSGKSTLARALGARTGLPVVHIDQIHWQPGWVERSRDEKTRLCHEIETSERWIFEGGHSTTWPNRLERAEMLIWLDLPVGLRFWRILKRTVIWHGRNRPDLPQGCDEGFHRETLPFWRYIWRTRYSAAANIQRLWDHVPVAKARQRLTSTADVRAFLRGFPTPPPDAG